MSAAMKVVFGPCAVPRVLHNVSLRRLSSLNRSLRVAVPNNILACVQRGFYQAYDASQARASACFSTATTTEGSLTSAPLHCSGCGVSLQSRDQLASGYTPTLKHLQAAEAAAADAAARAASGLPSNHVTLRHEGLICQRCFSWKHYSNLLPVTVPPETYGAYLDSLRKATPGSLVLVKVVDIFDFEGSLLTDMRHFLSTASKQPGAANNVCLQVPVPLVLIINKIDLLPKDVSHDRIHTWVRRQAKGMGLSGKSGLKVAVSASSDSTAPVFDPFVYLHSVHLVSAAKNFGIRDVVAALDDSKKEASEWARLAFRKIKQLNATNADSRVEQAATELQKERYAKYYVLGTPNVGKSSLINAVLSEVWKIPLVSKTQTSDPAASPGAKQLSSLVLDAQDAKNIEAARHTDLDNRSLTAHVLESRKNPQTPDAPAAPRVYGTRRAAHVLDDNEARLLNDTLADYQRRKQGYEGGMEKHSDGWSNPAPFSADPLDAAISISKTNISQDNTSSGASGPPVPLLPFTTSPLPGTTLGVLGAPLDSHGHTHIFDTPGLVVDPVKQELFEAMATQRLDGGAQDNITVAIEGVDTRSKGQESSGLKTSSLAKLVPTKRFHFPTYRLTPGRSLFLGGLGRVDYINPVNTPLLFTMCTTLPVHTTRSDIADELWERHVGPRLREERERAGPGELLTPWFKPLQLHTSFALADILNSVHTAANTGVQTTSGAPSRSKMASAYSSGVAYELDLQPVSGARAGFTEPHTANTPEEDLSEVSRVARRHGARISSRYPLPATRKAFADIVFSGLGWAAIAPAVLPSQSKGYRPSSAAGTFDTGLESARFDVFVCPGVVLHLRPPLLPYETTGLRNDELLG